MYLLQTRGTRWYKGHTSTLWKGLWNSSDDIGADVCTRKSLTSPAMCFSSSHCCLCLQMATGTRTLWDRKNPFGPSLLPEFSQAPEFLHYLQEVFYCESFYFTTSRTERGKLFLSNLAVESGLSNVSVCSIMSDLTCVWFILRFPEMLFKIGFEISLLNYSGICFMSLPSVHHSVPTLSNSLL